MMPRRLPRGWGSRGVTATAASPSGDAPGEGRRRRDAPPSTDRGGAHAACPCRCRAPASARTRGSCRRGPAPQSRASRSTCSRMRLAAEMRTRNGSASTYSFSSAERVVVPRRSSLAETRRRRLDLVHVGAKRQDVEQRVEQRVAVFLNDIGGAGIAHERRAGGAADDGAGKRGRDVHARGRRARRAYMRSL